MFHFAKLARFLGLSIAAAFALGSCTGNQTSMVPASSSPASTLANTKKKPAAGGYTVTDLGAIAGDSVSKAYGLNSSGEVAGVSETPAAATATLFANGKATNINTLGAEVSVATAIGGTGQVAGYIFSTSGPANAFLYSNGSMVDLNNSMLFPAGTYAYGVNSSGEVVGQGWLQSSGVFHPFLYSGGKMADIGTLGGFQATADAINDSNQIAGSSLNSKSVQHAFLYKNGKMIDLGVPSGYVASGASAINNTGQVAGTLYVSGGSHAASYNGAWTDLGNFTGAVGTSATGINTSGQIVGTAVFPNTYHPFKPGKRVGVIERNGSLVDLSKLISGNTGFTITDALGINDAGQIAADGTNGSGQRRALLLTPN